MKLLVWNISQQLSLTLFKPSERLVKKTIYGIIRHETNLSFAVLQKLAFTSLFWSVKSKSSEIVLFESHDTTRLSDRSFDFPSNALTAGCLVICPFLKATVGIVFVYTLSMRT